jgi:hypothetical protein
MNVDHELELLFKYLRLALPSITFSSLVLLTFSN